MNRHYTFKKFVLFSFSLLFFDQFTLAQTAIKTVIVSSDMSVRVTQTVPARIAFDLSTVPADAIIDSGYLSMTLLKTIEKKMNLQVDRIATEPQEASGRLDIKNLFPLQKKDAIVNVKVLTKYLGLSSSRRISLALSAPIVGGAPDAEIQASFYAAAERVEGKTPRLIVYYHYPEAISDKMHAVAWASAHADYMHSSRSDVAYLGTEAGGFEFNKIHFNAIKTDLCMYDGNVYLVDNKLGETTLYAADELISSQDQAKKFRVNPDALNAPKVMPVIDPAGRLYYTSENEISILDLANGGKTTHAISIPAGKTVMAAPTVGPDGSLYVVFNDMVQAYSPFPKHQLMWVYFQNGTKSSLTLSKNGTMAYVIVYDGNKVVALNTNNGLPLATEGSVNMHHTITTDGPSIPLATTDGYLYVANSLFNADMMYVFDSQLNKIRTIEGKNISQPVSGKDGAVYFLKNDSLIKSGSKSFTALAPWGNNTLRSLVTDLSDNVYGLFTKGADQSVLYTYSGSTQKTSMTSEFQTSGIQKAVIIGQDGNLYTCTNDELIRIRPIFNHDYVFTKNDESLTNAVFRARQLSVPDNSNLSNRKTLIGSGGVTISGVVTSKGDISVESGAGISFGAGFTVQKGGVLSCKTGY